MQVLRACRQGRRGRVRVVATRTIRSTLFNRLMVDLPSRTMNISMPQRGPGLNQRVGLHSAQHKLARRSDGICAPWVLPLERSTGLSCGRRMILVTRKAVGEMDSQTVRVHRVGAPLRPLRRHRCRQQQVVVRHQFHLLLVRLTVQRFRIMSIR